MDKRRLKLLALHIAWRNYGKPYIWGGDDTILGFDCSGFVMEILQSVGALKDKTDKNAAGLWEHYKDCRVLQPHTGCLVFYKNSRGKIVHIEFCIDEYLKIGASGGGSKTTTKEAAAKANAFIKVRPIKSRGNIAGYADPFLDNAPWGK